MALRRVLLASSNRGVSGNMKDCPARYRLDHISPFSVPLGSLSCIKCPVINLALVFFIQRDLVQRSVTANTESLGGFRSRPLPYFQIFIYRARIRIIGA